MAHPDERGVYWCGQLEQPVKHHLDPSAEQSRYPAEYLADDEDGLFLWVYFVAVRLDAATELGTGMRGLVAYLAYVVDPSLGSDEMFDVNKVDWVATVQIDGVDTASQIEGADGEQPESPPIAAVSATTAAAPTPAQPADITAEEFRRRLDDVLATLGNLAGTNLGRDIPQPKEVNARRHSPAAGPTYSFDGHLFRYHSVHPIEGFYSRATTDPDELLYWIVDDVARTLAWAWARRTPSARIMTTGQAQSVLAMPLWHTLVNALDTNWGAQTQATTTRSGGTRCGVAFESRCRSLSTITAWRRRRGDRGRHRRIYGFAA